MAQIVEVDGAARSASAGTRSAPEVAVPHRRALRAGEDDRVGPGLRVVVQVVESGRMAGNRDEAAACVGLGRAEGVAAAGAAR